MVRLTDRPRKKNIFPYSFFLIRAINICHSVLVLILFLYLKAIVQVRISNKEKNMFSFPLSLFLFPYSFFLFPYWGDQCMSLDIGFDTIVLLITTIKQSNRVHISAKIV